MAERSFEMLVGLWAILKAGGAYLPINPDDPEERIQYLLTDTETKILLTQPHLAGKVDFAGDVIDLNNEELYQGDSANLENLNEARDLAYVIYTSGTTGKPKGNLTSHYNISRVVKNTNYIEITTEDKILQLSNYAFDGSTFDIFGAMLNGASLVLIDKQTVLELNKLSKIIKEQGITIFFVTTALFNTLVDTNIEYLAGVRKILFGGERISVSHTKRALEYLGKDRIIHVYGPTESTVFATYYFINEIDERVETIPIGKPLSNTQVFILDKNNQIQPVGVGGEVCIAGDGLARGYLNRPELTSEKFVPNPLCVKERIYRTGDLGRWLPDGSIEFLGRIDHQVKIRGFRIEPGEIEAQLLTFTGVKEAIVIDRKDRDGNKYLCAYLVVDKNVEVSLLEIKAFLAGELPAYMIPVHFVLMDKLPLTVNGKVNRKALPEPDGVALGVEYVAATNEIEENMVAIWSDILGVERIGINDNFFDLGGHSLRATTLASRVFKEMDIELPLQQIFKTPTLKELANFIISAEKNIDGFEQIIKPVEEREYYPVSSAQKRLFILNELEEATTTYNMPIPLLIEGKLDSDSLDKTFKKLINRHESLRTSFRLVNDEPVQVIHDEVNFKIDYLKWGDTELEEEILRDFIRPFDLSKAPLLRVALIEWDDKQLLIFDMHHIISDGVSMSVLTKEFVELYSGKELPELRIQYKDFTLWQNKLFNSDLIKKQENYWLETFGVHDNRYSEIPVLNMPTDFPRPAVLNFEGDKIAFTIDKELADKLNQVAKEKGATMYMVLLSIFNILLSKYSGHEDIIIGSPIAGRRHADLENIIGMFVNTLAMRNYPVAEKSFDEFLEDVKENALKAYENQDYQFEMLVDQLKLDRDLSRNPLFDVMFALQNANSTRFEMNGLKFMPYEIENKIAKFDLNLNAIETDEGIEFVLEYSTSLFKKVTIEKIARHFENIIREIVEKPTTQIAEIIIISNEERECILEKNSARMDYPEEKLIHQLFEEQVSKTPEKIALVFEDQFMTYEQLNAKSNQLARKLRKIGVGRNQLVGIMVNRSLEMLVGILGVLKAGGAYLPIDPEYPEVRIEYMLEDSKTNVLLGQTNLNELSFIGKRINLDDDNSYLADDTNLETINSSTDLAYVIYTSGSTGKPKGVQIGHKSVHNFINGIADKIEFIQDKAILSLTTICFDIFVLETLLPLTRGLKVVIANEEEQNTPELINNLLFKNQIDMIQMTPSRMQLMLVGNDELTGLRNLKEIMIGGETFPERLLEKLKSLTKARIYNMYGPTETTVWSTVKELTHSEKITIGQPITNTGIYILDKNANLVPENVAGELYISGDGLAKGYLNNPKLTDEKFVQNPYSLNEKMYRTGDLVRWLPDGELEFLGRIDHQVKIRGYRIESGEIEAQLLKHQAIKETVVIDREDQHGSKYLCAYFVEVRGRKSVAGELSIADLRAFLAKELPDYMIPSYFIQLDQLPLTPNGKIDRKALPEPDGSISIGVEYMAPSTIIEEKIALIWSEILGVEKVGVHDNFFELGGHSLRATTFISKFIKN